MTKEKRQRGRSPSGICCASVSNIYIIARLYAWDGTVAAAYRFPPRGISFRRAPRPGKSIGCHSLCHCELDGRVDAQLLKNTPTRGSRLSLVPSSVPTTESAALNDKRLPAGRSISWDRELPLPGMCVCFLCCRGVSLGNDRVKTGSCNFRWNIVFTLTKLTHWSIQQDIVFGYEIY